MKQGFIAVTLLAAALAGCGAEPVTHRNYREIGPGEGMFGDNLTWEWRRRGDNTPSGPATASAAEQEDFKKWRESAGSAERQEFEDWRAWQEWKRKNPK
jgi:hypothetical protein